MTEEGVRLVGVGGEGAPPTAGPATNNPIERLRGRLLRLGGSEALVPEDEPDTEKILSRGRQWGGDAAVPRPGLPNRCHQNAIWLWEENEETMRIATGYALAADGCWRQHSWCVDLGGNVVFETTEPRTSYYGFVMTVEECEDFIVI